MNEQEIRIELELLVQEIEVAKSLDEDNRDDVYDLMVGLRNMSPQFCDNDASLKASYYEWLKYNIFENKLPYPSSGSFLVAVEDYDNNINMLGPEDEVTDEQVELFDRLWNEIIRKK